MNSIKVSVIIPVYNEEAYLRQCLDSVLAQTLREIEVLCIDDGSTDCSSEILEAYALLDTRVHIFRQKNQYAGAARNLGLKYAKGQYLSFLDGDDYFETNMLEKMYQVAESKKLDIVICRSRQHNVETGIIQSPSYSFERSFLVKEDVFSGADLKYAGIFQITKGWAWDKLFRAEFVHNCGYIFPEFRSSEDGFFVYMLMARAYRMMCLEDSFVTHRINDKTSLSNTKDQNWQNGFRMFESIKAELLCQGIYDIYQQSFLNGAAHFLKWYLESMHSLEVLENCFHYIQKAIEPEFKILSKGRKYSFQPEVFDWYQEVVGSSIKEFLYRRWKEEAAKTENLQGILEKQGEALADRKWVFPFELFEKGKTLILYGAGKIGACYYTQLLASGFCKEVIWVDSAYQAYADMAQPVQNPSLVVHMKYDYIFIAIKDKNTQEKIRETLLKQGVRAEQIRCFGCVFQKQGGT